MEKGSKFYRILEMIPGLASWNVIPFLFWGSILIPKAVAYFVIAFLTFWLYQSFKSSVLGLRGYRKIKKAIATDWKQKYQTDKKDDWLSWDEIKHVILIPNYNESVEVISKNLENLSQQKGIKKENLVIVLAMEQRSEGHRQRADELIKKYQDRFGKLIATYHPDNITGEIKGKASN
ncbi:MAG: hypothetical protein ABID04_01880, partial [Patescibacteria group bacterium]